MSQAIKTYDANFEDWYKRMFNKTFDKKTDSLRKTDTMSDEDFEVGTNLYQAYLQKNNLLDQYNKANTSLENERNLSQQQASIQLDKLKKYIPTQIKSQGLGGLGVSESTMLKANNDYQNTMGKIASDIGARQLDLLQSYNTGVTDIEDNLATANQNTLNKYQEIARQEEELARQEQLRQEELARQEQLRQEELARQEQLRQEEILRANQENAFNTALVDIDNSSISNQEEMLKFIEGYKGSVSEDQFNSLMQSAINKAAQNLDLINKRNEEIARQEKAKQEELARLEKEKQEELARQQLEEQRNMIYNYYYEMLTNPEYFNGAGTMLTEDGKNKIQSYLDNNKSILGDELYNTYLNELNAREVYTNEQRDKDKAEEERIKRDGLIKEGKEYFDYGGSTYKIKKQLSSKSNEIAHNEDFKDQIKKMGYADPYNPNIPNGTTLEIKCDSSGKNDLTYEDFMLMDMSDWRNWVPFLNIYNQVNNWFNLDTRYVTYYDGQWYLSEKK